MVKHPHLLDAAYEYRGLLSRIAKQLGVARSSVWRVANGERKSKRIDEALAKEIARIENRLRRSASSKG
jgi:hypothetical protein